MQQDSYKTGGRCLLWIILIALGRQLSCCNKLALKVFCPHSHPFCTFLAPQSPWAIVIIPYSNCKKLMSILTILWLYCDWQLCLSIIPVDQVLLSHKSNNYELHFACQLPLNCVTEVPLCNWKPVSPGGGQETYSLEMYHTNCQLNLNCLAEFRDQNCDEQMLRPLTSSYNINAEYAERCLIIIWICCTCCHTNRPEVLQSTLDKIDLKQEDRIDDYQILQILQFNSWSAFEALAIRLEDSCCICFSFRQIVVKLSINCHRSWMQWDPAVQSQAA